MARTLLVRMANGVGTPTAELILRGQFAVTETVTLVEHATAKRTYTGTVTAAAGTYDINLKSGAAYIGGDVVVLSGVDGTTSRAQGIDGDLSGTTVADVSSLSAAQAEPGQGAPAANASALTKIGYLFKAWRNRKTQTATQYSLYNDDAATIDHKATVSDDGTTTTVGEVTTGP